MEWKTIINQEIGKDYMKQLATYIHNERVDRIICPDEIDVFRAFALTPFSETKVVILGQDPYHDGNADGLAFSCKRRLSPSLTKVLEAVDETTLGVKWNRLVSVPVRLDKWADQGVLLINTILTVERGFAGSHKGIGWETFTERILKELLVDEAPKVFLIWGNEAKEIYGKVHHQLLVNGVGSRTLVIVSEHPMAAAYSNRAWRHNDCFNKANTYLIQNGRGTINWAI